MRGETFVTRKITRALARIVLGLQDKVFLGNMNAKRDWGHAKDYVEMQWLMLQQETPRDFVIATGRQFSVRDFVTIAAAELGVELEWQGEGVDEKAVISAVNKTVLRSHHVGRCPLDTLPRVGSVIVEVDPRYFRPTEVETLLGDPTLAKRELGWEPKITFEDMVKEMVVEDLSLAAKDKVCRDNGFKVYDYNE
jgi:GDPmannose 4,6-dehydratase